MQYARKLRKGDKVAIVSLSSGMLGEEFCSHNIEIGVKRLKEISTLKEKGVFDVVSGVLVGKPQDEGKRRITPRIPCSPQLCHN